MDDYEFPEVPAIEKAYRTAHRALEKIVAMDRERVAFAPEVGEPFFEVVSQFPFMVREAQMVITGHLGPRVSWQGPCVEGDWDLIIAGVDFGDTDTDFGVELDDSAYGGEGWQDCPLERAARAYRREARWDFAPGEAGVWLLTLAPTSACGGEDEMFYFGHLAGFAILYDRDKDGTHESVGHVWTARAWRRRGIARRLLREARERFGSDRIEGPYTEDGAALVKAMPEFGKSRSGRIVQ